VRRERKSDEKEREINSLSERNCIGEIPFAVTESYIFVYSLCGRCRCCEGSEKVIVPAYWRGASAARVGHLRFPRWGHLGSLRLICGVHIRSQRYCIRFEI
jgi:hypothetical protein